MRTRNIRANINSQLSDRFRRSECSVSRSLGPPVPTGCIVSSQPNSIFIFLAALLILCCFLPPHFATVLHKLVDVKGNGAFREVRIMYDLYHGREREPGKPSTPSSSPPTAGDSVNTYRADVAGPYTAKWYPTGILYPWSHPQVLAHGPSDSVMSSSTQHHPQYYVEQNMLRPYANQPTRVTIQNVVSHKLIRDRPLFVEVDFVPKYIPQQTYYVAVSVTLPAHIRGRPWILGWHQEVFPIPTCRLCTNNDQSFTLPVTLFLPDDGWCPEGRVPSIWKIEAISRESNNRVMDQTDMIMAYGYDDLRQLFISNDANSTVHCRGINEAIVA